MEHKGDAAFRICLSAVGLGVAGAALFKGAGLGLNLVAWTALLFAAAVYCTKSGAGRLSRTTLLGLGVMTLASLGLSWYSSPDIRVANWIALGTGFGLAALGTQAVRVAAASVWDMTGRMVVEGFRLVGEGLSVPAKVPWQRLSESPTARKNTAVLRGVVIATPLVLLFGALFSSADAVFSKTVSDAFAFDITDGVEWVSLTVLFGAIGLAVAGGFALPAIAKPPREFAAKKIGLTEVSVVLCSLCGLFGLFVAIQFQYFFGGNAAVVETTGLSYAEYARKGFFELVWVAGLALPLLVGAHAVAPQESRREVALFRVLATVLTGLLFVVMASAMTRMQIYVESYGLTPLRVSVSAFMLWLALVLCWFLASLFRGSMQRFAAGGVAAGLAVIAALNFATPDKIAAQYNVVRFGSSADLDVGHLAELGPESVPVVLAHWSSLSEGAQKRVSEKYEERWSAQADWRGSTVSGLAARVAIARKRG